MFSQNQVTDVMISNASGDVVIKTGAGGTVSGAGSFIVKQKLSDGTYRTSGVINPDDVLYVSKTVSVTAIPSYLSFPLAVKGSGYSHQATIVINQFGSKSYEDQNFNVGQVVESATINTTAELSLEMVKSIAANYKSYAHNGATKKLVPTAGFTAIYENDDDRPDTTSGAAGTFYYVIETGKIFEGDGETDISALDASTIGSTAGTYIWVNPFFELINTAAGTVYVVEKAQPYSRGHIGYERLDFNATYKVYDSVASDDYTTGVVTKVKGDENPLASQRVEDLEYFAMGNYGDLYDGAGYPFNRIREYYAKEASVYTTSFLIQKSLRGAGNEYGTNSESTLQIFCTSADAATIETAIETSLGITLASGTNKVDVR